MTDTIETGLEVLIVAQLAGSVAAAGDLSSPVGMSEEKALPRGVAPARSRKVEDLPEIEPDGDEA